MAVSRMDKSPCGSGARGESARARRQIARQAPRVLGARRAVAAEILDPLRQVDCVAAEAAFGEDDGEFGGERRRADARRGDQHARQPRRQRQAGDGLAFVADLAVGVERAERSKQRARLLERGARRRIEKPEPRRVGDAPHREIERQAGEVGGENLRLGERRSIDFQVQATNLLNHVTITSWGTVLNSSTWGMASNAAAMRKVTFNLRFRF